MDRAKLAALRKKKLDRKLAEDKAKHSEILKSQSDVALAIKSLHETLNAQQPYDDTKLIEQVEELKKSLTFNQEIEKIEKAIKEIPSEATNFTNLIKSVETLKLGNNNIVKSIKALIDTIEEQTPSQSPEDYMPTRRVRRVGGRLIFDDDPMQVNVSGGGGGGSSTPTVNGSVPVVNPDGSVIGGEATKTQRYDIQGDIIYEGFAIVGVMDNETGWIITKYDLTDLTDASGKVATDVSWNDRNTGVYE